LIGKHGVAVIPTADCPASFIKDPAVKVLAPEARAASYVWTAQAPGVFWLACSVGDHCQEDQKIQITVA
jgi:hypothetical protein